MKTKQSARQGSLGYLEFQEKSQQSWKLWNLNIERNNVQAPRRLHFHGQEVIRTMNMMGPDTKNPLRVASEKCVLFYLYSLPMENQFQRTLWFPSLFP